MKLSKLKTGFCKFNCCDILMWVVPLLLIVPNIVLDITEIQYTITTCIANVLLPLGVYWLATSLHRRAATAVLLLIPFMVLAAFQIVLIFLYGESIIAIDMFLNVVTTNFNEATELLGNLTSAIITVCVLYAPPIIAAIFASVKHIESSVCQRQVVRYTGAVTTVFGAIALALATMSPTFAIDRQIFPINVISNMVSAYDRTIQTNRYFETSADFSFDAEITDSIAPDIVVLVIGETSRTDNWQLGGYGRHTNPRLSKREGLVFFNRAISESNTTHKSVPLLMSHLDADAFGDSIFCTKGVIDAFDEAGFSTAWFSNQRRNGALIDFFGMAADSVKFITDDRSAHYDMELCELLHDFWADNVREKSFVVLHTYGSHFNYRDRYPEAYRVYDNDSYIDASALCRDELINAYDNTIVYTDAVVDSIISIVEASDRSAAVLYLSDHGEDVFDDYRGRFLHASPTPTFEQVHVPMIVWLSQQYSAANPEIVSALNGNVNKNVSSSRSVFHTLLSLAHISSPKYRAEASLCDSAFVEPTRVYLTDYNEAVALPESGMRDIDFEQFKLHSISY